MLALQTAPQTVKRFAFSADGARLAVTGTGKKIYLWDLTAQHLEPTVLPTPDGSPVDWEWVGFLPDGNLFALGTYGQYVTHDPVTGTNVSARLESERWVGQIVATPDRSAFYGTGNEAQRWTFDGRLDEVWNHRIPDTTRDVVTGRGGLVLPPDGTVVAAVSNGSGKTWLHTRAAGTGKLTSKRLLTSALIRDLSLLPDGRTIAFIREKPKEGKLSSALMTGVLGAKCKVAVPQAGAAEFTALALHPSGPWAAVGQSDGLVRVFDTRSWSEVTAHQWAAQPIESLAFAPDGLKAAAGFGPEGQFVVWDVDL